MKLTEFLSLAGLGLTLRRAFSRDNLTQPSTIKAIVRFVVSFFALEMSPEVQDMIVQVIVKIIALGTLASGLIDFFKNEHGAATKAAAKVASNVAESVAQDVAQTTVDRAMEAMPWQTPAEAAAYRAGLEAAKINQPKE